MELRNEDLVLEEYQVPEKMVGLIIGRKGEQITRLQSETGCKINLASKSNGTANRPCILKGSRISTKACKSMIEQIISKANSPFSSNNQYAAEMAIPEPKAGLHIPKRRKSISTKQDTSAKRDSTEQKFIPGSLAESSEIFNFPFTSDDDTMDFLKDHGRIMFIIRGPPGTGKDSLTKMLTDQYLTATICSADSYFGNTFSSSKRDPQSLRLSHEFCHTKVKAACERSKHPIIVKNTHMKKFELQKYLDFAAEYNYTVIMAVTVHKFEVTPEILARSNTKGLSAEYFERRLKQWEEVIPLVVGWFLNPEDSSCLLGELQKALDSLLGDGKFCRILNAFDKNDLLKHYKARKLLYCTAACGENNRCTDIQSFYLSKKIQDNYGKCFRIVILGYLVTPSFVSAVVHLDESMKTLRYIRTSSKHRGGDMDSLLKRFSSLDLQGNLKKHSATIDFNVDFKGIKNTVKQEKKCDDEDINISHCSSMLLAESDKSHSPMKYVDFFFKLLTEAADTNGVIRSDQLIELDKNMKVYRLSADAWLIKPPYKLSFKSIYTGLYI